MRHVYLLEPELCLSCRFARLPEPGSLYITCTRRDCDNHSTAPKVAMLSLDDRLLVHEITSRICREMEDDGA